MTEQLFCFSSHYQFLYLKKSNIFSNTVCSTGDKFSHLKKKSICKVYNFTFILKDLPLGIESQITVGHGSARLQSQSLEGTGRMGFQVILGYRYVPEVAWSPASSQHRGQCYLEQFSDCARRWLHCWSQKLWGSSALDSCRAHGARLWHSPVCGAAGWCRVVSSWELGIFLLT